jgi:hypothetical protein
VTGPAAASAAGTRTRRGGVPVPVLVGAVCGLAWAGSLRAVMAEFAGAGSTFDWVGTYEGILLPGAVAGGLLGWAEHRWLTGDGRRLRRLAPAPLLFTVDPASLMVTLPALAGGYALSGQGSRRARWTTGACALLPVPLFFLAVIFLDDIRTLGTPRGSWTVVLLFSHLAVLTLACTIPRRAPEAVPAAGAPGAGSVAGSGAGTPPA